MKYYFWPFVMLLFGCREPVEKENPYRQEAIPWPSLADSPWPMHHHDSQSTGRFDGIGAPNGEILWEYESFGGYDCGPVIGEDGTIYVVSSYDTTNSGYRNTILKAISPEGQLIWSLPIQINSWYPQATEITPVIDKDDNIYVCNYYGRVVKVSTSGDVLWEYQHFNNLNHRGEFVLDYDGNILFVDGDGNLNSLSHDGILNWSVAEEGGFGNYFAMSPEGDRIYISGHDSSLVCLNPMGQEILRFETLRQVTSPITVSSQGQIIYGLTKVYNDSTNNFITMVNNEGQNLWDYSNDDLIFGDVMNGFSLDMEGNIVFVHNSKLYSITYEGDSNWSIPLLYGSLTNPVCDKSGNVFATDVHFGDNNFVYSYSNDGTLNWQVNLQAYMCQFSPAFDENGVMYIVTDKNEDSNYFSKLIAVY